MNKWRKISIFVVFSAFLIIIAGRTIEDSLVKPPEIESLSTISGVIVYKGECTGKRKNKGIQVDLKEKEIIKSIRLPCTKELSNLKAGTEIFIKYRDMNPIFDSNHKEVWDVRSEDIIYYSYDSRLERFKQHNSLLNYIMYVLAAASAIGVFYVFKKNIFV